MGKDDPPTGNGYREDRKAIALRFKNIDKAIEVATRALEERFESIDKAIEALGEKHKHHYHAEKDMRALINKARGAWMAIAVISSMVVALMAYFRG